MLGTLIIKDYLIFVNCYKINVNIGIILRTTNIENNESSDVFILTIKQM